MEECEKFTLSGIRSRGDQESKDKGRGNIENLCWRLLLKVGRVSPSVACSKAVSSIIERLVLKPAEI